MWWSLLTYDFQCIENLSWTLMLIDQCIMWCPFLDDHSRGLLDDTPKIVIILRCHLIKKGIFQWTVFGVPWYCPWYWAQKEHKRGGTHPLWESWFDIDLLWPCGGFSRVFVRVWKKYSIVGLVLMVQHPP